MSHVLTFSVMPALDPPADNARSLSGPTIEQARAFCVVADLGSYSAASRRLGTTRIAVHRLVARFATAIDRGPLITATTAGTATVTEAGQDVLAAARRFVHAADGLAGVDRVVRLSTYPAVAEQIVHAHPDLLGAAAGVELVDVTDASRAGAGSGLIADLMSGRLDLAIAPAGLGHPQSLHEVPLYEWTLRAVGLGDRASDEVRPRELATWSIAAAPAGHRSRKVLENAFAADRVPIAVSLETSSQELLRTVGHASPEHVAVLPDDAFGPPDRKLGPAVRSAEHDRYGGGYALYVRASDEKTDGDGDRSRRIAAIADVITETLRRDASA